LLEEPDLTSEQRQAALGQLADQTRQSVTAIMGDSALRRYERIQTRPWLKELSNVGELRAR